MPAGAARRAEGMLALAEHDSPESVRDLTLALAHSSAPVRAAAALGLARLRDPASTAALAAIVAGWTEPALARCRRAALATLADFRSEQAALELARALATVRPGEEPGLDERSALLVVVHADPTGVAPARVVRVLVTLLAHEGAAGRATTLLGLFPAESQAPLVRALRTARTPRVRSRAAQALGACRRDAAVNALLAALDDGAAEVRAEAARSLGEMRDPVAASPLQRVAADPDERVRGAARSALTALGAVATASGMAAGLTRLAHPTP
jgi:HEAT repeat protein